jgi:vanillate O-demethylase ferredoxin subunit
MLQLQVARLTREADGVLGIELRAPDGGTLPPFKAGAHIDLHMPGGLCRQYSLTNDPRERHRYCLGVGLAADSRGGSRFLHEKLKVGMTLQAGAPRSLFGLDPAATEHLFIAGGIGITPILSMIRDCEAAGIPWRLLYCVRSRARAAYLWDLAPHFAQVMLHVDEEQAGAHPDIAGFLAAAHEGTHVSCCGPGPLMDAVAQRAGEAGIPGASVHFERFAASPAATSGEDRPFTVVLARTDRRLQVGAAASILETLERNGIEVPFGCREGLCGACETPVLRGDAEHRDCVLSDQQRTANASIMICVSRARSEELVLDI